MPSAQVRGTPRIPTWLAGVISVALVALVGLAAAAGNPVATSPYVPPVPSSTARATATNSPVVLGPGLNDSGGWLGYVIVGLLLLSAIVLVVTIVVLVVRLFSGRNNGLLRRRVLEPEEFELLGDPLPDVDLLGRGAPVVDAVQAGLVDVVSGSDVRASIIAAWLRLEDAAAVVGTPRRDADAPDDLVRRLLASHQVGSARLQELAELYRRARFSHDHLGERDRAAAVQALSAVRADLLGEPLVTGDAGAVDGRWPTRWT